MTKFKYLLILILMIFILKSTYAQHYNADINDSISVIDAFINEIKEGKKFKEYHRGCSIPRSVRKKLKSIDKNFAFSKFSRIACNIKTAYLNSTNYFNRYYNPCLELKCVIKSKNIAFINYYSYHSYVRKTLHTLICQYSKYKVIVLPICAYQPSNVDEIYKRIKAKDFFVGTFY